MRERRSRRPPEPPPAWRRERRRRRNRLQPLAAAAALVEVFLLAWLVLAASFPVRKVDVTGAHELTVAQVKAAAGLNHPVSVFSVDAATIQRKLTAMPWVRSASVAAALPDRVLVSISEWQPVAVYHAAPSGKPYFLSSQGVVLGPATGDAGALLVIEGPQGTDPRPGRTAVEPRLLAAMVNIQRGFPALVGEQVGSMSLDCSGNLTLTTKRGWKAYFGRVLTPEEFAGLNDKLAALKAISGAVDLHSANLTYVNLMNPAAPAVGPPKDAKPAATPSPLPSGIRPAPAPTIQVVAPCR